MNKTNTSEAAESDTAATAALTGAMLWDELVNSYLLTGRGRTRNEYAEASEQDHEIFDHAAAAINARTEAQMENAYKRGMDEVHRVYSTENAKALLDDYADPPSDFVAAITELGGYSPSWQLNRTELENICLRAYAAYTTMNGDSGQAFISVRQLALLLHKAARAEAAEGEAGRLREILVSTLKALPELLSCGTCAAGFNVLCDTHAKKWTDIAVAEATLNLAALKDSAALTAPPQAAAQTIQWCTETVNGVTVRTADRIETEREVAAQETEVN